MVMNTGVCDVVDVSHSYCTVTVLYCTVLKINSVLTLYEICAMMMTLCHRYSICMYDDATMC